MEFDQGVRQAVEEAITDRFPHLREWDGLPDLVTVVLKTTLGHSGLRDHMNNLERRAAVAEGRLELVRVALS